jgi:cytochrome c oxidase subunit 3
VDKVVEAVPLNQGVEAAHTHSDPEGAKIGMWIFLITELMLFGGMFVIYSMYRYANSDAFHMAATELNVTVGTINTMILLTSSLTVVLAIAALQKGNKLLSIIFIITTIIFGFVFLVNKFFEWSEKFHHGLYPGGEELSNRPNGQILYFGLYYVMTGIHGLHIILGIIILSFMLVFIIRDKITGTNTSKLEISGLYWHLVDIIWIFLFPLFYLVR